MASGWRSSSERIGAPKCWWRSTAMAPPTRSICSSMTASPGSAIWQMTTDEQARLLLRCFGRGGVGLVLWQRIEEGRQFVGGFLDALEPGPGAQVHLCATCIRHLWDQTDV